MMINNDEHLFEYVGEVEKDQHTNLTSNVFALNVAIATNLSDAKSVDVHIRIDFVSIEVMQLASIQAQIAAWKPHN
jgi:hypothetical protein